MATEAAWLERKNPQEEEENEEKEAKKGKKEKRKKDLTLTGLLHGRS